MRTETEFYKALLMTPTYNHRRHILLENVMCVEKQMLDAGGGIHPGIVMQSIINLMEAKIIDTLDQYQRALDEVGSSALLVATPIARTNADHDKYETRHPVNKNFKPEYTALVASSVEKGKIFDGIDVSPQENLIRLKSAGILLPKHNA